MIWFYWHWMITWRKWANLQRSKLNAVNFTAKQNQLKQIHWTIEIMINNQQKCLIFIFHHLHLVIYSSQLFGIWGEAWKLYYRAKLLNYYILILNCLSGLNWSYFRDIKYFQGHQICSRTSNIFKDIKYFQGHQIFAWSQQENLKRSKFTMN